VLSNLRNSFWQIDVVDISELKPHEETYIEHVYRLLRDILDKGYIERPILVDINSMTILDGHHRVVALKYLNRRRIPVVLIDYLDDNVVKVYSWRSGYMVTKYDVLYRAKRGLLYPPKTSRHVTSFEIPRIDIDISLL